MPSPDLAVIEALRASPIARGLSPEQTQVLAGLLSLRLWQRGEVLAQERTVDDRLIAIVEGSIAVVKHRGTPDESLLVTLQPATSPTSSASWRARRAIPRSWRWIRRAC